MNERSLVSVVIPTLNEEGILPTTLRRLQDARSPVEVIVSDGGSTDRTRARAREAGATVLHSPRGRGAQLNKGARSANGNILFFLHADTLPPPNAITIIRETLAAPSATAGTFRLQFDQTTPLLRFYGWCTQWPWIRLCFGDRGLFVTRRAFRHVGGYPEWPVFEDLELASRLYEHGGFHFLDENVTTSARRFRRNGILRQQMRNLHLWLHYVVGTDPKRISHYYTYGNR